MEEFKAYIESIVQGLGLDRKNRADLEDEILDHLVMLKQQYLEKGLPEHEAVQKAITAFGDEKKLKKDFKKVLLPFKYLHTALLICFIVYIVAVFWNLFLTNTQYMLTSGRQINLIPLATLVHYYEVLRHIRSPAMLKYIYGNLLLFIPFGLLLPLLFENARKIYRVLLCAFIFGIFLELAQYATFTGIADIDSVLLRTAGAVTGYLGYVTMAKAAAWINTDSLLQKITSR